MTPSELFRHCPRCGAARPGEQVGQIPFRCGGCNLIYYFNPTVAAAAFLFDAEGRVLLIRRAKDPAKGKFGVPGGFIDIGETAEQALRREVREEVGLEIEDVRFLASFPNQYHYREVTYPVCDLIFTAKAIEPYKAQALDGVDGMGWMSLLEVNADDLAFPSMRNSLRLLTMV